MHSLFNQGREGGSIPTSPLQLRLTEIEVKLACELNRLWHSRLPILPWSNVVRNTYAVCFGASFEDRFFAVGIWSSPVSSNIDRLTVIELRRFAIAPDAPKNTASRLLSIMLRLVAKKFPLLKSVVSYQDTAVHAGTIYKAAGWTMGGATDPRGTRFVGPTRERATPQAPTQKIRWQKTLEEIT